MIWEATYFEGKCLWLGMKKLWFSLTIVRLLSRCFSIMQSETLEMYGRLCRTIEVEIYLDVQSRGWRRIMYMFSSSRPSPSI